MGTPARSWAVRHGAGHAQGAGAVHAWLVTCGTETGSSSRAQDLAGSAPSPFCAATHRCQNAAQPAHASKSEGKVELGCIRDSGLPGLSPNTSICCHLTSRNSTKELAYHSSIKSITSFLPFHTAFFSTEGGSEEPERFQQPPDHEA